MAKLTTTWIKHNLLPVFVAYSEMANNLQEELAEEAIKPYLDQMPQAPTGYRASYGLNANFSTFMPLGDVYDKNGRTGDWKSMLYTKAQQEIIDRLRKEIAVNMDAWTLEFVNNNEVLQRVIREQPRLQRKYDRAYNRVESTQDFNEYMNDSQGDSDDQDIIEMTKVENLVRQRSIGNMLKYVLWDDFVEYTHIMSIDYAEMEAEYAAEYA